MPPILNAQGIAKSYGVVPLFENLAFTISDGDRIGIVGPNGSGKSTLLEILAGKVNPDSGEVTRQRLARVALVSQNSQFPPAATVWSVMQDAVRRTAIPESEAEPQSREILGRAGFKDFHQSTETLSGGWRKRLAIAAALVEEPNVLLLDEPTNHLDLDGIEWLENLLRSASFAWVSVSHDRYFLENAASSMVELNRVYSLGTLRIEGNYSTFLEKKEEYLMAQTRHQEALANRVRREMEWLRRGPKARTTKSKARIDSANNMISELANLQARTQTATAGLEFSASRRQTKRLVEFDGVSYRAGDRLLFDNLNFVLTAGIRLGLVGPNGSGKTTLLRLLQGEHAPQSGEVRRATALRTVYFEQNRQLDPSLTLRRALAPDSDSVVYQGRVLHVASWAERFLFTGEQLNQPVGRLSGGERARVLIARLMLQPADLLLLDEPTNDLDIPTLEVLEESLLEFQGAIVLVTHDRFLLDRVSTSVLGLDGSGGVAQFADYSQWSAWKEEMEAIQTRPEKQISRETAPATPPRPGRKKLSYLEAREYAAIDQTIAAAEQHLQACRAALETPQIASHAAELEKALAAVAEAEKKLDSLYHRWTELEAKQSEGQSESSGSLPGR